MGAVSTLNKYRFGVGPAAADASVFETFALVQQVAPPPRITLSPDAQKCYFLVPAGQPLWHIYMSNYFEVPMMVVRTAEVVGVMYDVYETIDLQRFADAENNVNGIVLSVRAS
jgi:hypothetical protein